jgi:hypothetical protein
LALPIIISLRTIAWIPYCADPSRGNDLPPSRGIGLEFREDAGPDEDYFITKRSRVTKRTSRVDLQHPMRHLIEQVRKSWCKARRYQRLSQRHTLDGRPRSPTRHCGLSPTGDDAPASWPVQGKYINRYILPS